MTQSMIKVTSPLFPSLEAYTNDLQEIWDSEWLSNNGAKHQQLELALQEYLQAPNISLFNNGTIALLTAVQSLRLQGEVITTPFSFPATAHVLAWNNITPVFCDIHPERLTIDPAKIESLITAKTSAILGVHVYGVPCHVDEIQAIADRHGLRVIYDAAHAFTTEHKKQPIAAYGDISMFSFHPTKLFHTGEGGALIYNNSHLKQRLEYLKNFGIKNEEEVLLPGINGKMNELQAAMGLNVLPLVRAEQEARQQIRLLYTKAFKDVVGLKIVTMPADTTNSEQYFCIRINATEFGRSRDVVYTHLKQHKIMARKYFYPLMSNYPCYNSLASANPLALPQATKIAQEVLCLPFYGGLTEVEITNINRIILNA